MTGSDSILGYSSVSKNFTKIGTKSLVCVEWILHIALLYRKVIKLLGICDPLFRSVFLEMAEPIYINLDSFDRYNLATDQV